LLRQIATKLVNLFVAFFVTVSLTFFLMKCIPGDPFTTPQGVPQEIIDAMHQHYGFNDPLVVQYKRYLAGVFRGDFGPSFKYKDRMVIDIIRDHFPVSAHLGLQALCLAITIGISIGAFSALRTKYDGLFACAISLYTAVPSFVIAAVLQFFIAIKFGWLPIARWGSFAQTILPTLSLAALPTAFIARLVRTSIRKTASENFVMTARAKGLSENEILLRHILPNSALPVIAFLGFNILTILSGSFTVERIFGIPGTGQAMVTAVANRDYTLIMGLAIFYSAIFLVAIFLADMLSLVLDPRLRTKRRAYG